MRDYQSLKAGYLFATLLFSYCAFWATGCTQEKGKNNSSMMALAFIDSGNGHITISAPILNDLSIQNYNENAVTLAQPTFLKAGNPKPSVVAFIGEHSTINISNDVVSNYTEGMIDVSGSNYQFQGLDGNKNYTIIVVAKNSIGSSVKILNHSPGWMKDVTADVNELKSIPVQDFLSGDDTDPARLTQPLSLPSSGSHGTTITWSSSNPQTISPDGSITRYLNTSVTVTLTATVKKDNVTDNTTTFTFTVYRYLFYDGFEDGNLDGWNLYDPYNNFDASINTSYSAIGTGSMQLDSSSSWGPRVNYPAGLNPSYIGYYARVSSTTNEKGSLCLYHDGDVITFITFSPEGNIIVGTGTGTHLDYDAYTTNVWYHIELKNINWSTHRYQLYINNVLKDASVPFMHTMHQMTEFILYNPNYSISWYDEILIY